MPEQTLLFGLFKFGEERFMNEFQKQGKLHMNTLRYFRENHKSDKIDTPLRHDEGEGLKAQFQPDQVKVEIAGRGIDSGVIIGPIQTTIDEELDMNVFCMYVLKYEGGSPHIDEQNFEFGDSVVIVTDVNEFLHRIDDHFDRQGIPMKRGLVEYVDAESHHGSMGPFRKHSEYSFQNEYRIAVAPTTGNPRDFYIGSIKDISVVLAAD